MPHALLCHHQRANARRGPERGPVRVPSWSRWAPHPHTHEDTLTRTLLPARGSLAGACPVTRSTPSDIWYGCTAGRTNDPRTRRVVRWTAVVTTWGTAVSATGRSDLGAGVRAGRRPGRRRGRAVRDARRSTPCPAPADPGWLAPAGAAVPQTVTRALQRTTRRLRRSFLCPAVRTPVRSPIRRLAGDGRAKHGVPPNRGRAGSGRTTHIRAGSVRPQESRSSRRPQAAFRAGDCWRLGRTASLACGRTGSPAMTTCDRRAAAAGSASVRSRRCSG